MRYQTAIRIKQAWQNMPNDHLFEDSDQFYEIAEQLGEVSGNGTNWFYTRRFDDEPFSPENIRLVHVEVDEDWDRVLDPAI